MTTHEVLIRARAEAEKGWCRKYIADIDGRVCTRGAVDVALGAPRDFYRSFVIYADDDHPAIQVLHGLLAELDCEDRYTQSIEGFNDHPSTTKADVLALFDRGIAAIAPVGDPAHEFATVG